ncbi:MAG: NAD(P)-dependent oxidoreductase [Acidimicrobiales bacterium]
MKIAFIGLGNIGGGAATNLCRGGHDLTVYDLDDAKVRGLEEYGAQPGRSVQHACAEADVVFTSLPGPAHVEEIASGSDGIVHSVSPGSIWIELSTNDLDTARRVARLAAERAVRMIDAPVSGGPEGASAGTLSIFVGGAADDVATVRPLLETIGGKVDHLGSFGAGIVAKIAQVTLCYTQTVALVEALLLGVKGGVDPARMLDLIQHSAGSSYVADAYGPEILAGTYDSSFPIGHAAKDMRLATELAGTLGVDLTFMADVHELYARAEHEYGSTAAHLLAVQLIERRNELILHEHPTGEDR